MLRDINALYLKKDSEIDGTLFKKCFIAENTEEAQKLYDSNEISLLICDLEVENAKNFIASVRRKYSNFPLVILEKIPTKKYEFEFLFKVLKPFSIDTVRKKMSSNEKVIEEFFEKNIQKHITVGQSIELFFDKKNSAIDEILSTTNISKGMDFEIMKVFVNTAYNNFVFIDKKIERGALKGIKENYDKIQRMYRNLLRSTDKGIKELYRVIYLESHYEYKKNKKLLEDGKKAVFEFQKRVKRINDRTLEIQTELERNLSEGERANLTQEKKTLKGNYTDIVHNISLFQEANHNYVKRMEAIEAEHLEEFVSEFDIQKEDIKEKYQVLLNKFTYYFNKQLWLEAKKSKIILEYFDNGQVTGFLNSKTYLEYYLSNVDPNKAGENIRTMVNYLKEYNKNNRINIAILTEDEEFYHGYSPVIRRIDNTLFTYQYNKIDTFIKNFEKYNFEIIVIDFYSSIIKSKKMLQLLKDKLPDNVVITSIAKEIPDKKLIFKNFTAENKDTFQRDFKLILT